MKTLRPVVFAGFVGMLTAAIAIPAFAQHAARVSMETARAAAIKRIDGTVISQEYEKEGGRWIYTFDIRPKGETGKRIIEVNVDADSGKIVDVHAEAS